MKEQSQTPLPNAFPLFNGIRFSAVDKNRGEAVLEIGPNSLNPYGLLHGGVYYTMADCAGGAACRTDGRRYVTLHGGIDFIHGVRSGTVTAVAVVRHRGKSTCQVAVDLTDEAGTLLATGDFTFFCLDQH